ncbi:MAG: hypothetical protein AABY00_00820 [Nanoarchaeota archaeon]
MNITRYVEYFSICTKNRTGVPVRESAAKLHNALQDATIADGRVSVVDCQGEFVLDRRWRQQTQMFPEFCVVFEYECGKGKDLAGVYADRESLDLVERVFSKELVVNESVRGGIYNRKAEFDSTLHSLRYPIQVSFNSNSERLQEQSNELHVSCTGHPSERELREMKAFCEERFVDVTFYPSIARDGKWYKEGPHHVISEPIVPQFDLIATWEGENFDNKAIDLYGTLRFMLGRTHCDILEQYAGKLIRSRFPNDESVALTTEKTSPYSGLSDMCCHMECKVPFVHVRSKGETALVGGLWYHHFIGAN